MCGRITLEELTWREFREWLSLVSWPEAEIATSYNVPPTAMLPIVRRTREGLAGAFARWGLVPPWHKGTLREWRAHTINARAEEVANKPAYRDAYRRQRCLVLVSGYYEWQVREGRKHPHYIHPSGNAPALIMAGLWTEVRLPDHAGLTCTVLTEAVRQPLDVVHDRMPVMMPVEAIDVWLDGQPVDQLPRLPMEALAWHEVGTAVSAVRNDGPDLIRQVEEPTPLL